MIEELPQSSVVCRIFRNFFEFFLDFFGGDFSANSAFLVVLVSVFAAAFGAGGSRSLRTALELL